MLGKYVIACINDILIYFPSFKTHVSARSSSISSSTSYMWRGRNSTSINAPFYSCSTWTSPRWLPPSTGQQPIQSKTYKSSLASPTFPVLHPGFQLYSSSLNVAVPKGTQVPDLEPRSQGGSELAQDCFHHSSHCQAPQSFKALHCRGRCL